MLTLLALAPILTVLVLMIGLHRPAAQAGPVGLAVALAVALLGFDLGGDAPGAAVLGALLEAAFIAATILWIVFPALCLHELQQAQGAIPVLRRALGRVSQDPRIAVILIGVFLALFFEGAAGFGTPIALVAPILVSLGYGPVPAVAVALIAHSVGVSFGAVGTPVLAQLALTPFAAVELSRATGLLHAALGTLMLAAAMRAAAQAQPSVAAAGPILPWTALAAACFFLPFAAFAAFVGPELPTLGGALAGGLAFVLLVRLPGQTGAAAPAGETPLLKATLPYLLLTGLIVATRLVPPLQEALRGVAWSWSLGGGFGGAVQPLYHPGTLLLLGFALGGLLRGDGAGALGGAMARAARKLVPVTVALAAMLALSRVMVHGGMIAHLAEVAALSFGPVWPAAAPLVGILGTFVTGSATSSNILFTEFQAATAERAGLAALPLVAGQGFGAAVGNIICPHNIIAGGATVGLRGREGAVLRLTLPACALYAAAGGLLLLLLAARWG